ncbi:uncharacterized protein M6B38_138135 [Iris pallida]|uniref:Phosphorylated adapter RNA export protein n=1 Tax=Iris pallida TaxID=29817 RepID=A0AAX6FEX9_IRIPA|nr:uncharacterized protein M6B38_138135 [Iris pallida]
MDAPGANILESILEEVDEVETLDFDDDDVDMFDADTDAGAPAGLDDVAAASSAAVEGGGGDRKVSACKKKKKNRNKKRKRKGGDAPNITDINRFVVDTCRRLREKKSYLVWNAIGCLGVSAVSDLVKEVDVILGCGGQKTTDGKRLRTGGGILWNILKSREPNAYKEIMAKGKEFEKQLWQPKKRQATNRTDAEAPQNASGGDVVDNSKQLPEMQQGLESADSSKGRISVRDRIRLPVSYEDLYEEGEVHE